MTDQPTLNSGAVIPAAVVPEAKYETVLDFTTPTGQTVYLPANRVPSAILSVISGDLILQQHRRWSLVLEDGSRHDNLCLSAILTLKEGGFEVLSRDATGQTVQ